MIAMSATTLRTTTVAASTVKYGRVRSSHISPQIRVSSWPFTYQSPSSSLHNRQSTKMHPRSTITPSFSLHDKFWVAAPTDEFTQSTEELKTRVREALRNTTDPKETLKMIDTIQHLGISHHFEQYVDPILRGLCGWEAGDDLSATALRFRLLRHNAVFTSSSSSDVFKKFMDERGRFKESILRDTSGLLSLYEASYLGADDEDILKEAMHFTELHLRRSLPQLSPEEGRHVERALRLPRHLRMARLEARDYIHEYEKCSDHTPALLTLAKLDFDIVQSLHQKELTEICRWWKELGLVDKLGFARDRPAECFLWTVGIFPEPCYSDCRIELTKTICILLVMDDIFDSYGSLDDLVLFTEAIRRWDFDAMEGLPAYMKICYMALYNTTNEIAYRVQKGHGLTVVAHLKRTWIDVFEAFLEEAKWFNGGHIPRFEEYLENGVTSAGSYMALVHSFFLMGDDLSKQNISTMNPYPRLFTVSGQILRLWDDLGTSREEQERGDNASSIECYMRDNPHSEDDRARKYVRERIGKLWWELNSIAVASNSLPWSAVKASLNVARTAQVIYEHGEDKSAYSVDDHVQALLFQSFSNC